MRNSRVLSHSGITDSWARRRPGRSSRRHWVHIESAAREAAIRSAAWSSTPQIRHHARMSASAGGVRACSIREHFDSCHPAAAATARLVSPASSLISRRRSAICCLACCTVDEVTMVQSYTGAWSGRLVLPVRYRPVPHRLERRRARLDLGRVLGYLPALWRDLALAGEVGPEHPAVVEHPEVVTGQQEIGGPAPGEPSDLLPCRDVHERDVVLPPDVLADRLAHDPRPADGNTPTARLSNEVHPPTPTQIPVYGIRPMALLPGAAHGV